MFRGVLQPKVKVVFCGEPAKNLRHAANAGTQLRPSDLVLSNPPPNSGSLLPIDGFFPVGTAAQPSERWHSKIVPCGRQKPHTNWWCGIWKLNINALVVATTKRQTIRVCNNADVNVCFNSCLTNCSWSMNAGYVAR